MRDGAQRKCGGAMGESHAEGSLESLAVSSADGEIGLVIGRVLESVKVLGERTASLVDENDALRIQLRDERELSARLRARVSDFKRKASHSQVQVEDLRNVNAQTASEMRLLRKQVDSVGMRDVEMGALRVRCLQLEREKDALKQCLRDLNYLQARASLMDSDSV